MTYQMKSSKALSQQQSYLISTSKMDKLLVLWLPYVYSIVGTSRI